MEEKDRKDLKKLHAGFEGGGRGHKPRNAGENWRGRETGFPEGKEPC